MEDNEVLTRREDEVARAYAGGASHKQIADDLCVAPSTVRTHINAVYRKLNVKTKIELLRTLEGHTPLAPNGAPADVSADSGSSRLQARPRWYGSILSVLMIAAVIAVVAVTRIAPPSSEGRISIAVLPFDFDAGNAGQARLATGLVRDLVTDLAQFTTLFVFASDTTFHYAETDKTAEEIGRLLGARYTIFGDIQWQESTVQVNVRVMAVDGAEIVWTERFVQPREQLPVLQSRIASSVASQLGSIEVGAGRLKRAELDRIARASTTSLTAYDHYLKGWDHYVGYTEPENLAARQQFEAAIKADQNFAKAHAMLGWTYLVQLWNGSSVPPDVSLAQAAAHVDTAMRVDVAEPFSHWALGAVRLFQRQHSASLEAFKQALALNPSNAELMMYVGWALTYLGDPDSAFPYFEKAIELNPVHPGWYYWDWAFAYFVARRYDEAAEVLERRSPKTTGTYQLLAAIYAMNGESETAMKSAQKAMEMDGSITVETAAEIEPFRNPEDLQHYLTAMRLAGFPERRP